MISIDLAITIFVILEIVNVWGMLSWFHFKRIDGRLIIHETDDKIKCQYEIYKPIEDMRDTQRIIVEVRKDSP